MPERSSKEPAIKLFGKKIPLPFGGDSPAISGEGSPSSDKEKVLKREEQPEKDCSSGEVTETTQEDDAPPPSSGAEESADPETLSDSNVNPKTPSISEESAKSRNSKAEKEQSDASKSQEKPLKKPDKILPCPRCNSMETKFCYYNNYNINQPRHFCKACQRYWTAGGTMRNVPVGAGRRKNKNSSSHFRHITISEALQAARIDAPIGTHHHPALKTNGTVLSFGLEAPICDSMTSILNLADKKVLNSTQNGFHRFEGKQNPSPCKVGEIGDDCSSSVTVSSSVEEAGTNYPQEPFVRSINGFAPPIPCLPGVPWAYPWNSAVAPPPALCPPGFPMPFYPAAYWNCGMAGAWNIPMLSPQCSSSLNQKEQCPSPNSPLLGKHSRDNSDLKPDELEKGVALKHKNGCVLVPKILRIDDPNEAAKSSIWTTLGIKNESIGREGLFKAFQPKGDEKNRPAVNYPALRANPAALSRSIDFHESA